MPTERIRTTEIVHKYIWPEAPLTTWSFFMWYFVTFQLGVYATFMSIQTTMGLGQPWLFPFEVTVGALGTGFLVLIGVLRQTNKLLPNVIMVGSFLLFVLTLTAVIEGGIMMFRPNGVNSECSASNLAPDGVSATTLAYIAQQGICSLWQASFALNLISLVFLIWIWIMAWQVSNDDYE